MTVLAPLEEVANYLSVSRLTIHNIIVPVHAVVGLGLLATTLAGTDMVSVLPNCELSRRLQRLESLVTDVAGVNPFSLLWFFRPY